MDCTICNQLIQPDSRIIQMSCCTNEYHTQCYMTEMSQYYSPYCIGCGTLFFYHAHPFPPTPPSDIHSANPTFDTERRVVKKAYAACKKGHTVLRKAVNVEVAGFKAQAAPLIASLKAMKREAIFTIKLSQGWREGSLAVRRYKAIASRFKKKFLLSYDTMCHLGLDHTWRTHPASYLRRKFRLRI